MSQSIAIAVVDDESLFRHGLILLMSEEPRIKVVWEASNGREALEKLADQASDFPHILLLDLKMPVLNGIETAKIIRERHADIRIIVLSTYFSKSFVLNMLEIGAAAYLAKNAEPDLVIHTILQVADQGFYYDQQVMRYMRENLMEPKTMAAPLAFQATLSDREKEVLQLICEQLTTSEIANRLFISPRTVDGHRNNLLAKLGCRNTAGLVIEAIRLGLVQIDPGFE